MSSGWSPDPNQEVRHHDLNGACQDMETDHGVFVSQGTEIDYESGTFGKDVWIGEHVVISKDVDIGANAVIFDGVLVDVGAKIGEGAVIYAKIGKNAVIGKGAVVYTAVGDDEVIADGVIVGSV